MSEMTEIAIAGKFDLPSTARQMIIRPRNWRYMMTRKHKNALRSIWRRNLSPAGLCRRIIAFLMKNAFFKNCDVSMCSVLSANSVSDESNAYIWLNNILQHATCLHPPPEVDFVAEQNNLSLDRVLDRNS